MGVRKDGVNVTVGIFFQSDGNGGRIISDMLLHTSDVHAFQSCKNGVDGGMVKFPQSFSALSTIEVPRIANPIGW